MRCERVDKYFPESEKSEFKPLFFIRLSKSTFFIPIHWNCVIRAVWQKYRIHQVSDSTRNPEYDFLPSNLDNSQWKILLRLLDSIQSSTNIFQNVCLTWSRWIHGKPHKQGLKHKIFQLYKPIISKAMEVGTFFFFILILQFLLQLSAVTQLQQERQQEKFQVSSLNSTSASNEELLLLKKKLVLVFV